MYKIKHILNSIVYFLKKTTGRFLNFITPDNINVNESSAKRFRLGLLILIGVFFLQGIIILAAIYITVKTGGKPTILANVEGMMKEEAISLLEKEGFKVEIESEVFSGYDEEIVMVQNPKANTKIKTGRIINLIVNKKNSVISMPELTGMSYKEALAVISNSIMKKDINVVIEEPGYAFDRTKNIGAVLYQEPVPSKLLSQDVSIRLVVNSTNIKASVAIANFVGANFINAVSFLEMNGIPVKIRTQTATPDMTDNVLQQSVPPGIYDIKDIETPIVLTVGVVEGASATPSVRRFAYTIPNDRKTDSNLKIILKDDKGERTLYDKKIKAGERVSFAYSLTGFGTVKIYYDNAIYETFEVQ